MLAACAAESLPASWSPAPSGNGGSGNGGGGEATVVDSARSWLDAQVTESTPGFAPLAPLALMS